ncbi:hypothetical protein [Enterococcus olivae]
MIDHGIVYSTEKPDPKVIDTESVWINTDIKPHSTPATEDEPGFEGFSYRMKQYDKDEYLLQISEKNANLEGQLIETQMALVEIYESAVE